MLLLLQLNSLAPDMIRHPTAYGLSRIVDVAGTLSRYGRQ